MGGQVRSRHTSVFVYSPATIARVPDGLGLRVRYRHLEPCRSKLFFSLPKD